MGGSGRILANFWLSELVRKCTGYGLGGVVVLWNFSGPKLFLYEQVYRSGEL
jgi:hypothetical protein